MDYLAACRRWIMGCVCIVLMPVCIVSNTDAQLEVLTSLSDISSKRDTFNLDTLEFRTFKWFWELAHPENFQIPDRWPANTFSSIAATGFGLSAYVVGSERNFISRKQAADRVRATLQVLLELPQHDSLMKVSGYRGFFYHFLEKDSGLRYKNTELSTIDTGLLMAGVLVCMSYFDRENEADIRNMADQLYRRVEYDWMLNSENRLSMGWRPESGFIYSDWHGYNEAMILLIQALGSPEHSIPSEAWDSWCQSYYWDNYQGLDMINFGPLFGHQYSHIFVDFQGIQDDYTESKGIDYFENSKRATTANRLYCVSQRDKFKGFSYLSWGLSACDGPADDLRKSSLPEHLKQAELNRFQGYSARGAASDYEQNDGTITPTAVGGSVPFAPEVCIATLKFLWEIHYDSLVTPYGFKDAFNLNATFAGQRPGGWFASDMLGIDQGAILLMIANYKDGIVWNQLKKNKYIIRGLKRAGFSGGWLDEVDPPDYNQNINSMQNFDIPIDPQALFERQVFTTHDANKLPYRLLKPIKDTVETKYPLVVFLHGASERGTNNSAQLKNGVMVFAENSIRLSYPAYVLAPQCPPDVRWSQVDHTWKKAEFTVEPTTPMEALMELTDWILTEYSDIDTDRIYVVGLSMGGFGSFDLLARWPDRVSAAMILCGGADPGIAPKIVHIPMRIFHGATDLVVPVQLSRDIVEALRNLGGKPEYFEYSTLSHHIWQETFYNPDNLNWLFSQQKTN